MTSQKRLCLLVAYVVLVMLSMNYTRKPAAAAMQTRQRPLLLVRGYIAASVGGHQNTPGAVKGPAHDVFLPGVKVYLKDLLNGEDTKPVTTDLSGRFTVLRRARVDIACVGRLRVLWTIARRTSTRLEAGRCT